MYEFTCPKCGEHRLEEVMIDVTVASKVTDVSEDGDVDYGEQSNEDGTVERYQCMDCGHVLVEEDDDGTNVEHTTVTQQSELAAWLKKRGMLD